MINQYLEHLGLPELAIDAAEFSHISSWIIAILDQYRALREPSPASTTTYSQEKFDLLYFLPQDELISQLLRNPLESPASDNYKEFLLSLYYILPREYKTKWIIYELSAGILAANTTCYQYQKLKLNREAAIAVIDPSSSQIAATAISSVPEDESASQTNNFISIDLPNLNIHPGVELAHPIDKNIQLTMGDAHGNVIRMIHFLVYQGVMIIEPQEYQNLVIKYHELAKLFMDLNQLIHCDASDEKISAIVDRIEVLIPEFIQIMTTKSRFNTVGLVRFIGDITGDRGVLDYLVLKLLECMKNAGVLFEIMLSNHDLNLIVFYEFCLNNPAMEIEMGRIAAKFTTFPNDSTNNMLIMIEFEVLDRHEICKTIDYCYKPALKLISYSINDSGTKGNIFTHAPTQADVIPAIARRLGLNLHVSSVHAFLSSLDAINRAIHVYVQANMLMDILNPYLEFYTRGYNPDKYNPSANPFVSILWNKDLRLRPLSPVAGCEFMQVHGHEIAIKPRKGFEGLDSLLGKELCFHNALDARHKPEDIALMIYRILYSKQNSSLQSKLITRRASYPGLFAPMPESIQSPAEFTPTPSECGASGIMPT